MRYFVAHDIYLLTDGANRSEHSVIINSWTVPSSVLELVLTFLESEGERERELKGLETFN